MRGKDEYYHQLVNYIRITPAYAGKSGASVFFSAGFEDHPRLCGEKCKNMHNKVLD